MNKKDNGLRQSYSEHIPGDWQIVPLKDMVDEGKPIVYGIVQAGPHVEDGVPYIKSSDIRRSIDLNSLQRTSPEIAGQYKRSEIRPGDIVFSLRGNIGACCIVPDHLFLSNLTQGTARISIKNSICKDYVYYALQSNITSRQISAVAKGSTFREISLEELRKLNILVPSFSEQRKIAEILSTWDETIALTEQLIAAKQQRKQLLMQRLLLVRRGDESPKHRFPTFSRPWQQLHFGNIFERVTRKNAIGNNTVLTISAQRGLISQTQFFNKIVASDSLSGYYLLMRGEFAYNKSYSEGYPYGAFKRLNDYDAGVLSTLYVCFCIKAPNMNSDYFVHFFEAGGMNHGIYSIAQEGARNHGLLNISVNDLFNLTILIPSLEEQNALASFFNDLDHEIDLLKQKLAALQQQKHGLMQQLLTGKIRVKV